MGNRLEDDSGPRPPVVPLVQGSNGHRWRSFIVGAATAAVPVLVARTAHQTGISEIPKQEQRAELLVRGGGAELVELAFIHRAITAADEASNWLAERGQAEGSITFLVPAVYINHVGWLPRLHTVRAHGQFARMEP